MNRQEQQAMVERLKTTNTVFCGLPRNEQEFIEKHLRDCVEIDVYGCWTEAELPIHACMLLRLSPDFQLPAPASYVFAEDRPKERWLFHIPSKTVYSYTWSQKQDNKDWIKITAGQKRYLETKHEGYELLVAKKGDRVICLACGREEICGTDFTSDCDINGIRWVKVPVKQEPCFVEYVISKNIDEEYICDVEHREHVKMLYELPSIVGFAGYKFFWEDGTETDWLEDCPFIQPDGTPATPIAARFYIKGETK
jgi:hypothetical protein